MTDDPQPPLDPTPASATTPHQSYEAAAERLEEIIKRLDSGAASLRETHDLVKEGRDLVVYCANELDAVGKDLEELHLDDLIARLESNGTPSAAPSE